MRDFNKAEHTLDILFKHFPDFDTFRLVDIIKQSGLSTPDQNIAHGNDAIEILLVDRFMYAEYVGTSKLFFKLSQLGRQVKNAGGYFAYLNHLADKKEADKERQQLNDEKLRYDVKNAKRIFKTYWWTFWFAVIAFIISSWLGVLKLIELLQPLHTK